MKLGLSQKLPVLAPALSAPTCPPSCPLFSSLQAAPPAPPLGALSSGKGSRSGASDGDLGLQLRLQLEVLEALGGGAGRPAERGWGYRGPPGCLSPGRHLSVIDSFLSSLLGPEQSCLDKTQGRVYSSLASGYHRLTLDCGGEGGLLPPNTRPPESQGCVSPSFQLCPLFFKQYLLQNHQLGGCSHVQSIFITAREDLGVTDSQMDRGS